MLQNILNLDGVTLLNKESQKLINGGVDKCCVRLPPGSGPQDPNWCNSSPGCMKSSPCGCGPDGLPKR